MILGNEDWLPYWQPDETCYKCNNCNSDMFSLMNPFGKKKHHCRDCGKIYCDDCWGKNKYIEIYKKEVPVCINCSEKNE